MRQKATKVTSASSTSWDWLKLPEKSSPAKTKTFLIHSFGLPVLIAACSGERRGTTWPVSGSCEVPCSAGTVGCSEVIVSIGGGGKGYRWWEMKRGPGAQWPGPLKHRLQAPRRRRRISYIM